MSHHHRNCCCDPCCEPCCCQNECITPNVGFLPNTGCFGNFGFGSGVWILILIAVFFCLCRPRC